jgi:hypothetical protein
MKYFGSAETRCKKKLQSAMQFAFDAGFLLHRRAILSSRCAGRSSEPGARPSNPTEIGDELLLMIRF